MSTTYSVTINLGNDTLRFLQGKSLRVFKGAVTDSTALPVVWFSQRDFAQEVTFSWQENYGGYVTDKGTPEEGFSVKDVSLSAMSLGQKLTVSTDGGTSLTTDGVAGAITVAAAAQDSRDWTGGMGQVVEGKLAPICAFDIGGAGETLVMEPYEKLVLVFESSTRVDTGTVYAAAISPSLTIELDGANTSRSVTFSKDGGWGSNTEGWATINPANLKLADALIVAPANQG